MKCGNKADDVLKVGDIGYVFAYSGSLPVYTTQTEAREAAVTVASNRFDDSPELLEIDVSFYMVEKIGDIEFEGNNDGGGGDPTEVTEEGEEILFTPERSAV